MIHGRILDLDSHLQVPISRWGEVFGEATSRFGKRFAGIPLFDATDEPDLTTESVWNTKGTAAPGASNPESRLAIEGHTDSVGAGEANLALATNWIAQQFGCLAFTIEMPFKDNADLPDPHVGWNGSRSAAKADSE